MNQTRICTKCHEERAADLFQKYKGKPSGQCRICKTAAMKIRRADQGIPVKNASRIVGDQKLCTCCKAMKAFTEFAKTPRGLGGMQTVCKSCFRERYAQTREQGRQATTSYRKRHRARHLAMHRVRMFERKTKQRATSDGTVTDEFLKELYATEHCHYCTQSTSDEERTADHKIPLAKGGAHSANNLVMACWTCNSSKRDLTEEEFIERLKCSKQK